MARRKLETGEPKEILAKCEALVRKGQLVPARALLNSISPSQMPTELRLRAARLARRTGQLHLGFRLLRGQLDFKTRNNRGQAAKLAEYCVLLIQNGNVEEAMRLLEKGDLRLHPDLLLAKAWAQFERWEYESSVGLLQQYVRLQSEPYLCLAGRINLAEAYVATERFERALKLLNSAILEAEKLGHVRLLGNGLHLRARAYFGLGQMAHSEKDLAWAMRIFGKKAASDAILIRRQQAINESAKTSSPKALQLFREEAVAAQDWESVRECDFQLLLCHFRPSLFLRLYFGTPYPAFRLRLQKAFGKRELPAQLHWGPRGASCLSLASRTFVFQARERKLTKQNFTLLVALARDFYRPLSVGGIFGALFPEEHFDPVLSPVRVHQSLKRLRLWLEREQIPLAVACEGQWYFLRLGKGIALSIPREENSLLALQRPLALLSRRFPPQTAWTAREARAALQLSKASVNRELAEAVAKGEIERQGAGKNTVYRFLSN